MLKVSKIIHKKGHRWNVDLEFILAFYDAYLREKNLQKVAASLEIRPWNLQDLIKKHPELQQAKEAADRNRVKSKLANYALSHLSPECRKIWNKLESLDTYEEIDELFKGKSVRLRQQLFCHAILHTGYDVSKACSLVGINRGVMNKWRDDLEFMAMLEEVQFHKKNFFENGIVALCHDLHPGALIFANRTINADRGYNEKLEITGQKQVLGPVTDFDISDLELDLETQRKILAAIEKWKKTHAVELEEDYDEEDSPAKIQALTLVR